MAFSSKYEMTYLKFRLYNTKVVESIVNDQ